MLLWAGPILLRPAFFPCDYQEREGKHDSMISTITPPHGQIKEYRQYESEYSRLNPNLDDSDD